MSDTLTVTGRCAEVSERGDWTTFHIDVGRQYPVKLSTKLPPIIELGRAASKAEGAFDWSYTESQGGANPHKPGEFFTNRYLTGVEPAGSVATPDAAPEPRAQSNHGSDGMTKEEWARKDSAIHKMACIKTAAAALTHTMPADPSFEDLNKFNERVIHLSQAFHRSVLAERDDPSGEDVPF